MYLFTAKLLHYTILLPGLYALDERGDAHIPGHLDDVGYDDVIFAAGREILHEFHVDLDKVKIHLLQQVEGGVFAAEIIHPHIKAVFAETADLIAQHFLIGYECRFRYLYLDKAVVVA